MSEPKIELVRQSLYASNHEMDDTEDEAQLRWPVYLNRNKRLMKRIRKDLELNESKNDQLTMSNGLVMRQVPHIKKLYFEPETSDFMVYRRKTKLDLEEEFLQSYKATLRFKQVLEARRLKIDDSAKSSPTSLQSSDKKADAVIQVPQLQPNSQKEA